MSEVRQRGYNRQRQMERDRVTRTRYVPSGQAARRSRARRRMRRRMELTLHFTFIVVFIIMLFLVISVFSGLFRAESTPASNMTSDGKKAENPENNSLQDGTPEPTEGQKLIVLDPGHGGKDPGAGEDTGTYEKEVNLAIAFKVEEALTAAGYRVIMTRESDVFYSLEERANLSNQNNADLFISIHQNSLENDTVTGGIETYYDIEDEEGRTLANYIQDNLVSHTNAKNRGTNNTQSLAVNRNTYAPSVLIECGFMTMPEELENLMDASYQEKIAAGIVAGVNQYFENRNN